MSWTFFHVGFLYFNIVCMLTCMRDWELHRSCPTDRRAPAAQREYSVRPHLRPVRWRLDTVRWRLGTVRWRLGTVRWCLDTVRWYLGTVRWRLGTVRWRRGRRFRRATVGPRYSPHSYPEKKLNNFTFRKYFLYNFHVYKSKTKCKRNRVKRKSWG